ncbi:TolC family protein [Methylobacter sp. Wu8]|uniref:TolC family protein n=1 Tax=Methylobacter sp. Wu8 TaxID=3118457 RepID=UPI002F2BD9B2
MPSHNHYVIGALLLLAATAANAETLEDAWSSAINNNHQIKAAKADTSASEQQLHSAEGQRLPDLNVSSSYTQLSETPAAKTQISGQTATFNMSQPGSVKAQAMASVPIFTSGRISHNINAAEASLQAVQSNETTSALNIKMQVAEAYIAVLRMESALQVALSHVDALELHMKDVNNLFDQGMVARNDVLTVNVELANARQLVVQASNQLDIAKARYNQLLDRNLADEVKLAHQFPETPQGTLNELSGNALKQRPELVTLAQQIESLEQQAQSVKAALLPQVAVNGGYQYQENRYQAFEGMWTANVGMDWKIFDGSSGHRSDALTRQAISLKEQRDDLSSMIGLQVRQAWLDIQETQKRIAVAQQAIAQADENMKVTADRYQQGLSTNTDVLKAEDLRTTSHGNFNNANYDATLAALHLRRALGIL